jgi:hypothetical protein
MAQDNQPPATNYFTAELLALVKPWARPDCERFGYDWPAA